MRKGPKKWWGEPQVIKRVEKNANGGVAGALEPHHQRCKNKENTIEYIVSPSTALYS